MSHLIKDENNFLSFSDFAERYNTFLKAKKYTSVQNSREQKKNKSPTDSQRIRPDNSRRVHAGKPRKYWWDVYRTPFLCTNLKSQN